MQIPSEDKNFAWTEVCDSVGCGSCFHTGFVSHKEKYKQTPQQVIGYVESLELQSFTGKWLNFVRIDQAETM